MKIILTHEVARLGSPGDVVEVKNGYGRNYLIPQGFAMPWTKGGQKQVETIKRARAARDYRDAASAQEVANQLAKVKVRITAPTGTGGRLFGSITTSEVVDAVVAADGPKLDRRRLELPGHIKSVGNYKVSIKLHPEVSATFNLEIVAAKKK